MTAKVETLHITADDIDPDMLKVAALARSLDLHGVIILSHRCPACGQAHNFELHTDFDDADSPKVAAMLRDFADAYDARPVGGVEHPDRKPS